MIKLKNKKAFVPFITAGDPSLELTAKYITALDEAGADIIELGIPFSDPVADGRIIQEADLRALDGGASVAKVFKMLDTVKPKASLVFLTYFNPVFNYGVGKFFADCKGKIDGIIIPDCPLEEQDDFCAFASANDVDVIQLVSPLSGARIKSIGERAEGFVYLVSSLGVTGERKDASDLRELCAEVKKYTNVPVFVGFGVTNEPQAKEYATYLDGVIVGTKIVKMIGDEGEGAIPKIKEFTKSMIKAMNG